MNDGNASFAVTGDQDKDLAKLTDEERKFFRENIKHREMQSKAGVKGRSATSVSAGSSKLIVMKLLTLMLQLKTRSLFQLTTRGFLRGSKVVNAMQSANKRVEEEAYQASRMVHLSEY